MSSFKLLPQWLSSKESTCNSGDGGDVGLIPGWERSPGRGYGNPLQYSCLENPMDRGLWLAVHSITKSLTSDLAHTDALRQLKYDSGNMYFWVKIYVRESYREKVL